MNGIESWALSHLPWVAAAGAALVSNLDRIIGLALKVASPDEIDMLLDKADAAAKAEVAKVAAQQKPPQA